MWQWHMPGATLHARHLPVLACRPHPLQAPRRTTTSRVLCWKWRHAAAVQAHRRLLVCWVMARGPRCWRLSATRCAPVCCVLSWERYPGVLAPLHVCMCAWACKAAFERGKGDRAHATVFAAALFVRLQSTEHGLHGTCDVLHNRTTTCIVLLTCVHRW